MILCNKACEERTLEWLLEEENPSVRFFTLTNLIEKPLDGTQVKNAQEAIMNTGLVPKIMEQQKEDGSWGEPLRFYRDKYRGTTWVLLLLAELGADVNDPGVRRACEFILENSQEPVGGGFSYDRSTKTGGGLPSGVVPCLTGNMVYSLVRLGFLDDPRVWNAISWITTYQRADDQSEEVPKGFPYDRYPMCWGRHSCHMGVAKTLKALAAIPENHRSEDVKRTIEKLAEYFLKHHLFKKSHNLEEISRPGWLKLGFPLMYQTDILELLLIFKRLNFQDQRLQEALDILKSKRLEEGSWKLENSFNGKMLVNVEQKGKPSKWITLRALEVLKE